MDHSRIPGILESAAAGERIGEDEALLLLQGAELTQLAWAATACRDRHNDPGRVSYVVDRNVNYTNICTTHCTFCAFYRGAGHPEAYVLGHDELRAKARETLAQGGTGFLLQGGVNPELPWEYYLDLVRFLHQDLGLWVHGFSPVEIQTMARLNGLGLEGTLAALKQAGLGSLPGGGAEILVDRVRMRVSPRKGGVERWTEVMEAAHAVGLHTTGTMMYGIVETLEERIQHLRVLREQQDRALARGQGRYTAFAAWPFQSGNTPWAGKLPRSTDADYLRLIAVARIYLDNFPHLQSSWVTMGPRTGQLALLYGCDDMGSLMLEENVVSAAGTRNRMEGRAHLERLIREAGFRPWQRDNVYGTVPAGSAD